MRLKTKWSMPLQVAIFSLEVLNNGGKDMAEMPVKSLLELESLARIIARDWPEYMVGGDLRRQGRRAGIDGTGRSVLPGYIHHDGAVHREETFRLQAQLLELHGLTDSLGASVGAELHHTRRAGRRVAGNRAAKGVKNPRWNFGPFKMPRPIKGK